MQCLNTSSQLINIIISRLVSVQLSLQYFACQVGNVSVSVEQLDLPAESGTSAVWRTSFSFFFSCRSKLQRWSHILVYSASSGAEQSTPFGLRIEDVTSSISSLEFVDKV